MRKEINPDVQLDIIKDNSTTHSIDTMCKVLKYSKSTYYDKEKEKLENKWKPINKKLQDNILKIYNDNNKIYRKRKKMYNSKWLCICRISSPTPMG